MKYTSRHNQHGAVLAFSLVMLLLLTLVSTSMIQQNKVQINVATNAGQQIRAFSSVETALATAQGTLELKRHADAAAKLAHRCKHDLANQILTIPDTSANVIDNGTVRAQVQREYCITSYDPATKRGTENQCFTDATGARLNTSTAVMAANPLLSSSQAALNAQACVNLTNGGWTAGIANYAGCNIEVYTLNVRFLDTTTNATRTIESKFEINCAGDSIP